MADEISASTDSNEACKEMSLDLVGMKDLGKTDQGTRLVYSIVVKDWINQDIDEPSEAYICPPQWMDSSGVYRKLYRLISRSLQTEQTIQSHPALNERSDTSHDQEASEDFGINTQPLDASFRGFYTNVMSGIAVQKAQEQRWAITHPLSKAESVLTPLNLLNRTDIASCIASINGSHSLAYPEKSATIYIKRSSRVKSFA